LSAPMWGLLVAFWLAIVTRPPGMEFWGWVEIWTLPLILVAMLALRRERWTAAVALALLAALVRELAVLLLIGGILAAWTSRRSLFPWALAIVVWIAALLAHIAATRSFLVPVGQEAPLLGTAGPLSIFTAAGPRTGPVGL